MIPKHISSGNKLLTNNSHHDLQSITDNNIDIDIYIILLKAYMLIYNLVGTYLRLYIYAV